MVTWDGGDDDAVDIVDGGEGGDVDIVDDGDDGGYNYKAGNCFLELTGAAKTEPRVRPSTRRLQQK